MFFNSSTVNRIHEQSCLDAYAKGYKDALMNSPDNWQPGVFNNSLYLPHYREGFLKAMLDTTDIENQIKQIEAA